MPFVGASIVPHSPLLLSTVGKEYLQQMKRTQRALLAVSHDLHALKPSVIVVVHPHGQSIKGSFSANVADRFTAKFAEFGDMVTTAEWKGAIALSEQVKERAENHGFPLTLIHTPEVSYDVGVPLLLIAKSLANFAILPIGVSSLHPAEHVNFGKLLAEEFHNLQERIYVVASAELSQHTTAAAPAGIRPEGALFDRAIVKSIGKKGWAEALLRVDPNTVELADTCGYHPILVLAGVLARQNVHAKKLSYESTFGIGILTATFLSA